MVAVPRSRFLSFQNTSILFCTVHVVDRVPLLADGAVQGILRDVWLHSALQDRWFVGIYRVMPDRLSLFASPGPNAVPAGSWLAAWQALTTGRINKVVGGSGPVWVGGALPVPVGSVQEYAIICQEMMTGIQATPHEEDRLPGACDGMIWELLPPGGTGWIRRAPLGVT